MTVEKFIPSPFCKLELGEERFKFKYNNCYVFIKSSSSYDCIGNIEVKRRETIQVSTLTSKRKS